MRCEATNWQVVENDLARQFDYVSDAGEDLCTIQFRVTLTIGGTGEIETRFCIVYAPAVSRAPEAYVAMQITPLARLTEGDFVNARVTCSGPVNKFWVDDAEDAAKIMEVLWAGEELRWLVVGTKMKSLLDMRVPHDKSFRTALTDMQAKVRGQRTRGLAIEQKFRVTKVSQSFSGRPLLHIEPAPLSHDGWPDLSPELENTIAPYIKNADNIALRYMDGGLPTTSTAVMGSVTVHEEGFAIEYAIRTMIFETKTSKPGCNIHIRPAFKCKLDKSDKIIAKVKINNPPVYDFREVYDDAEQSRDDLSRLVKIAHSDFMRSR